MAPPESQRLLKAHALRGLGSKIAFNYDDLKQQCDDYVETIRLQAAKMLTDAHQEAAKIRQQAVIDGRAEGQRAGMTESQQLIEKRSTEIAAQKTAEQLRTSLPALQASVDALKVERDRWLATWETGAIRLSVAIAEKILHSEISHQPDRVGKLVAEALQLVAGNPHVKIRMHPADMQVLRDVNHEVVQRLAALGEAAVTADEHMSRGGCLIETKHGIVDARLETQLARITDELLDGSM